MRNECWKNETLTMTPNKRVEKVLITVIMMTMRIMFYFPKEKVRLDWV